MKVGNVYCYSGGTFHWKVFIDQRPGVLRNIRCAVYSLYSTFKPYSRSLRRCHADYLEESGRGEFAMPVKVEWLNGTAADQLYTLDLDSSTVTSQLCARYQSIPSGEMFDLSDSHFSRLTW